MTYKQRSVKTLASRLEAKSELEPNTGCQLWTGARNSLGYGYVNMGRRGVGVSLAHRASWESVNGPVPNGLHVLHRCDTPSCINTDHLWLGTDADNQRDCMRKNRHDHSGLAIGWARKRRAA